MFTEHPEFTLVLIVALGIGAHWLAWALRLPSILLLLAAGLACGPVGLGVIDVSALLPTDALFAAVSAAVAVILFEGGLSLKLGELDRGGAPLRRLLWIGVPLAWALSALAFGLLYGHGWQLALVVGAILVVTGPTVIGPLLQQVRPTGRAGTIAKWEGIINDPIGAVLAVLMLEVLLGSGRPGAQWSGVLLGIATAIGVATAGGLGTAWLTVVLMRRGWLPDHLHGVATLALTLVLFFLCHLAQAESGLLAVTIYGAALANQTAVSVRHVSEFNEHLRTLLIALLFIVLAARFTPQQMAVLDWPSLVFLALLVLAIRPLCVLAATLRSDLPWADRALLAWMAPRGIVAAAIASLFAIKLDAAGTPGGDLIEPLIYVVIVGTVLVYGLGAAPLARLLGLKADARGGVLLIGAHSWARALARAVRDAGYPVQLIDSRRAHVVAARLEGLQASNFSVLEARLEEGGEPLPGIDQMLALTPSDEANALAAVRYAEIIGRSWVHQLAGEHHHDVGRPRELARHLSGRPLLGGAYSFADLEARFGGAAEAKVTQLTEAYDLDDYLAENGDKALPILVIRADGRLRAVEGDRPQAGPGDRLVALVATGGEQRPEDAG